MSRVHRRQFVLGPEPWPVRADWRTRPLGGGLHLSHAPDLPVDVRPEGVVCGRALGDGPPERWSGRWLLVREDGRLVLDAGATLGAVTDGTWWSSSVVLLRERAGRPSAPDATPLRHARTLEMDWYPPPATGCEGIRRLLPSQTADLRTGRVEARPLPAPSWRGGDVLEWAAGRLVEWVRSLHRPVWVPLTAGYDSRVLLAAALAAGADVTAFTSVKPARVMTPADRDLPPRIARRAGVAHRFLRPRAADPGRAAAWAAHSGGQAVGPDRDYVVRGQWAQVPAEAVVLRGSVWGVLRGFYKRWLPERAQADADAVVEAFAVPADRRAGIDAWARWAAEHPAAGLDWRDRFFHEQRTGGWLAALEQALDVTGTERVHLACCHELLSALLTLPQEERARHLHHVGLVRHLAPELLALPFNPPPSPVQRLRRRIGR